MYEKMIDDMNARMKPVLDLAETNKKAMEKLAGLQKDSVTEVINASVEQFKALSECKDPKSAIELQTQFYKALEAKVTDTAEKSITALNEAKDAYMATVEEATKKAMAEFDAAVKSASKK